MDLDRIGIVGPGAMGLFHAIYLAQVGLPVTLLDHRKSRARRISGGAALQRPGTDDAPGETIRLQVPCRAARMVKEPFDLLVFTVKAYATERAAEQAAHLIGPETVLVSLQNGLGNVEALQAHQKPELVLAGVTTSGATRVDEHTVIERGVGEITLGSTVRNHALAEGVATLLRRALPTKAVGDIWPVIWRKLAVNCAINPLTAMLDLPNGLLLDAPVRHLMGEVAFEVGQVARAVGVDLEPKELPHAVEEVCRLTADNISSMLQDTRAGRKTEIEQLNGAVAHVAEKVGMKAPLNMALAALLAAHEWRRELAWQQNEQRREARRQHRREMRAPTTQETDE
jgi:2-dehydropantoate 2-reductase